MPDALVTVVNTQWFGSEALELTYKTPDGKVANQLVYRHDEPRIEVVEQGRPWSVDGNGARFRAEFVARLGPRAETARELAYRLYTISERKKRAAEALSYNGLVQSWSEITRLAREGGKPRAEQPSVLTGDE